MKTCFPGILSLALSLCLCSCILPIFVRFPHHAAFNEAEFAPYDRPGSGAVSGRLVCSDQGHDYPGDGTPVTLLPVTSYTREMIDRELGDGVTLLPSDGRLKRYIHITHTDHEGNFSFTGIPAGTYFVAGESSWDDGSGPDLLAHQWACETITVKNGQTTRVMVTHNPQHGYSPINNIWTVE